MWHPALSCSCDWLTPHNWRPCSALKQCLSYDSTDTSRHTHLKHGNPHHKHPTAPLWLCCPNTPNGSPYDGVVGVGPAARRRQPD